MLADRKRIYFSLLDIKRNNEKFSFTFNFIKDKTANWFFRPKFRSIWSPSEARRPRNRWLFLTGSADRTRTCNL